MNLYIVYGPPLSQLIACATISIHEKYMHRYEWIWHLNEPNETVNDRSFWICNWTKKHPMAKLKYYGSFMSIVRHYSALTTKNCLCFFSFVSAGTWINARIHRFVDSYASKSTTTTTTKTKAFFTHIERIDNDIKWQRQERKRQEPNRKE